MNYKEYKGNIFKEDTLLSNEYIIDKLYELDYCNEEIEKLQEDIGNYVNIVLHDRKEIDRLHSIIKEVREHIEKTIEYEKSCGFNRWTYEDGQETYIDMVEKTLDILDKGE